MFIFVSGSINSGKTTTSQALSERLGAEYINVDDLNDEIPNFNLVTDLDKSMDAAINKVNEYFASGSEIVVANYVVREIDWERVLAEVKTDNKYLVTLAPRLEVAQGKRGDRKLTEWEVQRVKHHYNTGIATPKYGIVIDNSDIDIKQSVDEIIDKLGINSS